MKFSLEHDRRNITDEDLKKDLRRVASELNKGSLTQREYKEQGKFGVTTVIRRFGGWSMAAQSAGLKKTRASNLTKEELFENLESVWIKLGRQPSYGEVQKPLSLFHVASYDRKFGSWRAALEEFVEFVNSDDEIEKDNEEHKQIKTRRTSRTINLRLRFRVMKKDGFKCKICGKAPANDPNIVLEVDHVKPWSDGGETIEENLQTLCFSCNQGKSNLSM